MRTRALCASLLMLLVGGCGASPAASPSAAPSKPAASPAAAALASAKPAASASAAPAPSTKPAASGLVALKGAYITVSPTGAPSWVAKEMGIYAKNGIDASLTTVMPALTANELQFASSGAAEVAAINLQGGSMVMLAEGAALPIFSLYADK